MMEIKQGKDISTVGREVQERMMYWKGADQPAPPRKAPTGDRYLLFDYDVGGLNNIRIGWEMAAIAAHESNRTLVYPPRDMLYIVNAEPSGLDYYLNMERFHAGVSALSMKEFIQRVHGKHKLPSQLVEWAASENDANFPKGIYEKFRREHMKSVGSDDEHVCDIARYQGSAKMLYQDPKQARIFSCGNWPNVGEPRFHHLGYGHQWKTPSWAFELLRNNFVWHPDAFEIAGHVVEHLGLFSYVAMHARYGDFQFQAHKQPTDTLLNDGWLSTQSRGADGSSLLQVQGKHGFARRVVRKQGLSKAEEAVEAATLAREKGRRALGVVRRWLDKDHNRPIYISTDDRSKAYLEPFHEAGLRVVRWNELLEDAKEGRGPLAGMVEKYSPARFANLAGLVEQLICTYGHVFIGSEKSTFTGYIERMRLYAQAPTHATYIKYAGVSASDKGLRLFHDDRIDEAVETKVKDQIELWEQNGGALNRDDVGALPYGIG